MHKREKELFSLLAEQYKTLGDVQTMLKSLFKGTVETMLEAELEEHLGYEKHSVLGNSRNGYGKKAIKTELGKTEISVPRDRNSTF